MKNWHIRPALAADAARICDIYNHYVAHSTATFDEVPSTREFHQERIAAAANPRLPFLVGEAQGELLGYAYASEFKARSAYRHTVESTVYLAPGAEGQGLGSALYRALLLRLKQAEIYRVLACISIPNPDSIALHEKLGFEKCGHFDQLGYKLGRWVDVGYWQLKLSAEDTN